jgi:hypothetical protein
MKCRNGRSFLKFICFIDLFVDKFRKYEQLLASSQQTFAVVKQIRKNQSVEICPCSPDGCFQNEKNGATDLLILAP